MENLESIINSLNFSSLVWQIVGTFIFMLSDIISGVISAIIQKNLDSQKMREGLLRKMLLILVIFLSFVVQYSFRIDYVSKVVCIYIIVMEIISILENLKKSGLDLGKLGDLLKIKTEENTINLVVKKEKENKENGN